MAPSGRKPKPDGQAVTRHARAYGWIDVDPTPFDGGPKLPARRRDGSPWPSWIRQKWEAWRKMPHAALWQQADWAFALDTIEIAAQTVGDDVKVSLWTELRYREKVLGTTWAFRQDMRIRYTEPASAAPASVTHIDQYRDL
jgi:hypothetical protein